MTPTQTASRPLKLMAVLAHPDDESLGIGGTLARYAGEGVETYLVTATRGEASVAASAKAQKSRRLKSSVKCVRWNCAKRRGS